MTYIYRKIIGGKPYYYLRATQRNGKRTITKDIAYLGNTLAEVREAIARYPHNYLRKTYKTISRFLESNTFLEHARTLKLKSNPYLSKELLEQVEACRLHWQQVFQKRDEATKQEMIQSFIVDFAYNTTGIEGNTITLEEAARLLTDNIAPKQRSLREIYDLQNTETVFQQIFTQPKELTKDHLIALHAGLMKNIDVRIGYRTVDVRVFHSRFTATPAPYIKTDIELVLQWYQQQSKIMHPLVLAGIVHHQLERIHPFFDGNGRAGRMVLNEIMLRGGCPPFVIRKRNRPVYLNVLHAADASPLGKPTPKTHGKLIEFLATELIDTYWNIFL